MVFAPGSKIKFRPREAQPVNPHQNSAQVDLSGRDHVPNGDGSVLGAGDHDAVVEAQVLKEKQSKSFGKASRTSHVDRRGNNLLMTTEREEINKMSEKRIVRLKDKANEVV
jgi:hypothetical protein